MSDDQLDNDLKNRISQVFDNYDDNTAEEGWLLLRERYPEQEDSRDVAWLWRAGIAATLLIFLSIGLWLNFHPAVKQNLAMHSRKNKNTPAFTSTAIAKNKKHITDSGANNASRKIANTTNPSNTAVNGTSPVVPAIGNTHSYKPVNAGYVSLTKTADSSAKNSAYKSVNKSKPPIVIDSTLAIVNNGTPASPAKQNPAKPKAGAIEKSRSMAGNNLVSAGMQSLFDNEIKNKTGQNTEEQKTVSKKVTFGIYAATYINYAKGSDKQFNTGAGFTSDIKLTDNLRISTGLSIAQNSLNYNDGMPTSPILLFTALSHNFQASTNALSSVTPISRNLNANLVDLDIPVDLKYAFNSKKSNTYIAAGLSSGTFVNETYNYTYNYNVPNGSSLQQSQNETTRKGFDNFYFAKMLNVAFGVGYPLGKNNLIIEPFLKYPLNGLGDQHILFGSGGLNLKFNFDAPKSKR